MARPLSMTPERGDFITLDDLEDFVRDARAKGFPGGQRVRTMGALVGMSMTHGPFAARLTAVPGEETAT